MGCEPGAGAVESASDIPSIVSLAPKSQETRSRSLGCSEHRCPRCWTDLMEEAAGATKARSGSRFSRGIAMLGIFAPESTRDGNARTIARLESLVTRLRPDLPDGR